MSVRAGDGAGGSGTGDYRAGGSGTEGSGSGGAGTGSSGTGGAWGLLVASGVLEAVWASALAASEGFVHAVPTVVFLVASVASVFGLGQAMRRIPAGTAYAVWTGIGSVLTVAWAGATGAETLSLPKVLLLGGIIVCVAGLKLVDAGEPRLTRSPER